MRFLWRLRARRAAGDRGAALVEMILFTPILTMIAIGILEFGMGWRDSITVASALRAGARVGSNAGNDRLADYNTLLALQSAIASIPNARITRVVIYNATSTTTGQPSTTCKAGTASSATGAQCNVYTSTQLATMTSSNFSGTTGTTCSGASWDVTWCPLSRSAQQSAGADYMGVYIVVNHPYVTRMFPGGGITIDDNAVMRLEPST